MELKVVVLLITLLASTATEANGDLDDFCTLSGTIKGLSEFSSIFVKL